MNEIANINKFTNLFDNIKIFFILIVAKEQLS